MPSTYSSDLRLELQADGENSSTWGQKTNTNLQLLEDAISGMVSIATTGGTTTLTEVNGATDQSRFAILKFTGVLVSDATVVAPLATKQYLVWNATTGAYKLQVKTLGGTGPYVAQTSSAFVFCDGTDVAVADRAAMDSTFRLYDETDPTKIAAFQLSGITTGTTRTYTLPNASGTLLYDGATVTTIDINGGTIDGTVIGGASAAAITGTTITANTSFAGAHNGTVGATTPAAGTFTTLTSTGNATLGDAEATDTHAIKGATTLLANSSSAALTVTQTGAGNAFVVEDSTTPDSTPFAIDAAGYVGIGVTPAVTTRLYALNTSTGSGSEYGAYFEHKPTGASGNKYGSYSLVNTDTGYTGIAVLIGAYGAAVLDVTTNGAATDVVGVKAAPSVTAVTAVDDIVGVASESTISAAATINTVYGFYSNATNTGSASVDAMHHYATSTAAISGTANYGFFGNLAADGTKNWNFYAAGTASNYMAGDLVFAGGKGIDFSAVTGGTGTSTSNILDDYEEGTFTPVVTGSTVAGTATYAAQTGRYTKIGRVVFFNADVSWSGHTGTGNLTITALPFTALSTPSTAVSITCDNLALPAGTFLTAIVGGTSSTIQVYSITQTTGVEVSLAMDAAGRIQVSGHYTV